VPSSLTRLQSITGSAKRYVQESNSSLSAPLLLMDTGSAATVGALEDPKVRQQRECILCNIGNFHTLACHLEEGRITGVFEHHTGEISKARLEELLLKLAAGTLTNDEVFHDSGHGALMLRQPVAKERVFPFLSVTGPRRSLLNGSALQPYNATPCGDMMLAGCFGLLRALAEHLPELAPAIVPSLL
jgi:uncharacterized protein (DUF1786 family)